jgi:murein DD-endopeptidase MepM/ murein hydrolase activator NlpD
VLTFVLSAFLTYVVIEWFARPTEAYAPSLPPEASLVAAPDDPLDLGAAWPRPDLVPGPAWEAPLALPAEAPLPEAPAQGSREDRVPGGLRVVRHQVQWGGTLERALLESGIDATSVDAIVRALAPVDLRFAQPGDFFSLERGDAGSLASFEYQQGRRDIYRLRSSADGTLLPTHEEVPLERRVVRLSGVVHGSLFDTVLELGEEPDLVHEFAEIFAWDIDFAKETQPGDDFRIVFEKYFDRDGFVRYGHILGAQYRTAGRAFVAIFFEDLDGQGDYYRPDGTSIRRSFLRVPLRYTRISSPYSRARLHPILKVRRPHEGVDYAAPEGTPVWAVADGTVIFKGWDGGFGRLLKIRHDNGHVSYYGHLGAYADGVTAGASVRQKQVIGYVGATGLATGPHLDYRLKVGGRFVDPLQVDLPRGKSISVQDQDRFAPVRDERLRELAVVMPALPLSASR